MDTKVYIRDKEYGATTAGIATAYTLAIQGFGALEDLKSFNVKFHVTNGVNATLNINGLGAKLLVDQNNTALTAGLLDTDGVYIFAYNLTIDKFVYVNAVTAGSGSTDISVRARITVPQVIGQAVTPTVLTFGGEDFDTDNMHDNAVNNSRITINTAGKYAIGASPVIDNTNNFNGDGGGGLLLRLNGTTLIGGGSWGASFSNGGDPTFFFGGTANTIYDFIIGDYIEVLASGQYVNLGTFNTDSSFRAYKI